MTETVTGSKRNKTHTHTHTHTQNKCPRIPSMKYLKVNAMYFKKWDGQGSLKQREIVQNYTASVQLIGRTFRDKGEKARKGKCQ